MAFHGCHNGKECAFEREDALKLLLYELLPQAVTKGMEVTDVVPGVFDLLVGEEHAAPVAPA
jgi:hypothetical protein